MVFVVAVLGAAGRKTDSRVGVARVVVAQWHAKQRMRVPVGEMFLERGPESFGHLLRQEWHGRLRCDHQVGGGGEQRADVPLERGGLVLVGKLFFLRDVALHQGHAQNATGLCEGCRAGHGEGGDDQARCQRAAPALRRLGQRECRPGGEQGCDEADAIDAHPRREFCQGAVHMGIARGHPGKAREDHTARQFGEQPQRGKQRAVAPHVAAAPTCERSQRRGQVKRQEGAERRDGHCGHPRGQATVAVQADEQPPGSGKQPSGSKGPPESRGTAGTGRRSAPRQPGHTEVLQAPGGGVHIGQCLKGAQNGDEQQIQRQRKGWCGRTVHAQAPSPPGSTVAAWVTLNQRTAPPRVSITPNCKPPSATVSPRRGTRPNS